MSKEVRFKQIPNKDAEVNLLNLPQKNLSHNMTLLERIKEPMEKLSLLS